jgi:hypothetical protein
MENLVKDFDNKRKTKECDEEVYALVCAVQSIIKEGSGGIYVWDDRLSVQKKLIDSYKKYLKQRENNSDNLIFAILFLYSGNALNRSKKLSR